MRQLELMPNRRPGAAVEPIRPRGLPLADAALYLGVSRWTIQRLRSRGELEGYHVGAAAMITLDSLDAYLEAHRDRGRG